MVFCGGVNEYNFDKSSYSDNDFQFEPLLWTRAGLLQSIYTFIDTIACNSWIMQLLFAPMNNINIFQMHKQLLAIMFPAFNKFIADC